MSTPRWYSLDDLARATGLTHRYIRNLLDENLIWYWQPAPNAKRLLNDQTVASLEALGVPVNRAALTGNPGKPGENG